MNNFNLKRFLSTLCALALIVSVLACCNGNKDKTGSDASDVSDAGSSSKVEVIGDDEEIELPTPSDSVSEGAEDPWKDFDPYATISDSIKGQTVRFATWIDHTGTEGSIPLANFNSDTGLNVELYFVPQLNYEKTLLDRINAGDIPDVFVENNTFPLSLQYAAPIDLVSSVNLEEPVWNQDVIKYAKLNGHTYLLNTTVSPWAEADMVFFNKTLFEENGIKSPAEYYEEGNWTFDTLYKCAKEVAALGQDYVPLQTADDCFIGTAGANFVDYDPNTHKFTNNTGNANFLNVLEFNAKLYAEGLIKNDFQAFVNGKSGMQIIGTYGLKSTGYFQDMDPNDIGFTYLPTTTSDGTATVTRGIYRMYGIVDGAPHADAAGYFIRYWLDPNNYDLDNTYISKKAANFYFDITAKDRYFTFVTGASQLVGTTWYYVAKDVYHAAPGQVQTALDVQKNVCSEIADAANNLVQKTISDDANRTKSY